jgi:hypothetical protein
LVTGYSIERGDFPDVRIPATMQPLLALFGHLEKPTIAPASSTIMQLVRAVAKRA